MASFLFHPSYPHATPIDIICNGGINPYVTPVSKTVIPVTAGSTVTAFWGSVYVNTFPRLAAKFLLLATLSSLPGTT